MNSTQTYVNSGYNNLVILCDEYKSRLILNQALYANLIQAKGNDVY